MEQTKHGDRNYGLKYKLSEVWDGKSDLKSTNQPKLLPTSKLGTKDCEDIAHFLMRALNCWENTDS